MALKSLIDGEVINTGRQKSIDYVKAFAIFYMVTIHWYEEMSVCYADGTTSVLGYILEFLGGPLAAPVFMFSMGLGMIFSKHRTPLELFKRGVILLLVGYAFNIARICISYLIVGNIAGYFDMETFLYYTFNVDILNFCGVTFMFTALLKKCKVPIWSVPIVAIVMMTAGSLIQYEATTFVGKYFLALFIKCSDVSYFPLLNWYFFPAMGMIYGRYLRQAVDTDRWHRISLRLSIAFTVGILSAAFFYGINPIRFFTIEDDAYYLQNFMSAMFSLNVVLLCESLFYFLFKKVKIEKLDRLTFYMSNNLNTIYILQWLIIGNVLGTLYNGGWMPAFPIWVSIPLGIATTILSTYLSKFCNKILKF